MQFFRNMQEPASTDITQYSGYTKLSGDEQKKVAETYTNVYNNNQGKLGYRVAQGIAFETAKKMCESFVAEDKWHAGGGPGGSGTSIPSVAAAKKAWSATEVARASQTQKDHLAAQKAHVNAAKEYGNHRCNGKSCLQCSKVKEHRGQAGVHGSIAASYRKHEDGNPKFQREGQDPAPGVLTDEGGDSVVDNKISKPGPTYEGQTPQTTYKHRKAEYVGVYPKDVQDPEVEKVLSKIRPSKPVKEGDAEDFQAGNDALVGMTEDDAGLVSGAKKGRISESEEEDASDKAERASELAYKTGTSRHHNDAYHLHRNAAFLHMNAGNREKEIHHRQEAQSHVLNCPTRYCKESAISEMEDSVVSGANPEEDGAAKILRMNHDKMCVGCGAIHPLDVMCFNGRTHSEAGAGGGNGASDILKQNHAQKGMKVEDSDPEIAAAARYLTNRAKVSGLMESKEEPDTSKGDGAASIQKKNYSKNCPGCGAMHDPKDECNNQSEPDTDKDTKKEIDDANEILKKNHKDKGLEEKHIGFKALEGKLERSGKSKESAGAIAASIGDKKYGKSAMHKAAVSHTPLGEDDVLKTIPAGHHQFCDSLWKGGSCNCKEPAKPMFKEPAKPMFKEDEEINEAIEQMWAENFYPAKPMEEHCGHCGHPKSYHVNMKECGTCNECEQFTTETEVDEGEKKKQICFCGHAYGNHGKGGCHECKHEGVMNATQASHQFRKNDYKERFEDEYNQIFAAQQGKINTSLANASLNWLPEELELQEGKGYDDKKFTLSSEDGGRPERRKAQYVYGGVKEDAQPTAASKAWAATEKARNSQSEVDHRAAEKSHRNAESVHARTYAAKEHKDQADVHKYVADFIKKHGAKWTKHQPQTMKEDETEGYSSVLQKHGYKTRERNDTDADGSYFNHPKTGHEVTVHANGNWSHKGKNKKLVSTQGESPSSLHRHLSKVASQQRASSNRKDKDDVMRSLGLNKVKGSVSGKTYWEAEENPEEYEPGNYAAEETDPLIASALGYINQQVANAGGPLQPLHEGDAEHEQYKDHTKNPYHQTLTQHGFVHKSTEHKKNPFAANNPKADYTEHRYEHPEHGKSHVIVTQEHSKGGGDKGHSFHHQHEQSNGIMSPSTGNSKPQLHRSLSYHYGVPKGVEPPKLTASEKRYSHTAPKYKQNEEEVIESDWGGSRKEFAGPGSALRAASKSNPRNLPCPTCKEPNKLTAKDVAKKYQCDNCANMEERGW